MKGLGGLGGWSWIFILEGIITFVVGMFPNRHHCVPYGELTYIACFAFWAMYDYPATAKFLSEGEKAEVKRRLDADQNSLADEFNMKYFKQAISDWKIWVNCIITIGIFTCLYSFSLFLPTIVKTLGYTNNTAQLMTVPPYVVACFFCVGAGYMADKHKQRGVYIIGFCIIA